MNASHAAHHDPWDDVHIVSASPSQRSQIAATVVDRILDQEPHAMVYVFAHAATSDIEQYTSRANRISAIACDPFAQLTLVKALSKELAARVSVTRTAGEQFYRDVPTHSEEPRQLVALVVDNACDIFAGEDGRSIMRIIQQMTARKDATGCALITAGHEGLEKLSAIDASEHGRVHVIAP